MYKYHRGRTRWDTLFFQIKPRYYLNYLLVSLSDYIHALKHIDCYKISYIGSSPIFSLQQVVPLATYLVRDSENLKHADITKTSFTNTDYPFLGYLVKNFQTVVTFVNPFVALFFSFFNKLYIRSPHFINYIDD